MLPMEMFRAGCPVTGSIVMPVTNDFTVLTNLSSIFSPLPLRESTISLPINVTISDNEDVLYRSMKNVLKLSDITFWLKQWLIKPDFPILLIDIRTELRPLRILSTKTFVSKVLSQKYSCDIYSLLIIKGLICLICVCWVVQKYIKQSIIQNRLLKSNN